MITVSPFLSVAPPPDFFTVESRTSGPEVLGKCEHCDIIVTVDTGLCSVDDPLGDRFIVTHGDNIGAFDRILSTRQVTDEAFFSHIFPWLDSLHE